MQSTKLFWVLLLGVVATVLSLPAENLLEEVGILEAPLEPEAKAALDNQSLETGDSSESKDSHLRGMKITSTGRTGCTCRNTFCECCVSPKIPIAGKVEACLKATVFANQKSVNVQLTGKGKNLISHTFFIGGRERMCASVPASAGIVQGCIDTDTSNLRNNAGIQTCPKLELRTVGKTVATLSFACIQYANKRVSLNNNGRVKANQKVGFKFF
ncbi:hypothetical protein GE061_016630 [Apolygus lucorum]|uniref:Uncharacterized protein n=1 Tax=Apolygus lucorum TaxID=248454 RepID=A0A6A4JF61_APOLU|nr:hypothetical protein GE061_016630 [Apolygus lucorum]